MSDLFLADKSALEQVRHSDAARRTILELTRVGTLATCEPVALEVLYSARNFAEYEAANVSLHDQRWLPIGAEAGAVALDVQRRLARRGQHRLPVLDLLIAATAQVHGATVLHYDRDFERIAEVTGQPHRWIIPAGSGHGAGR